MIVGCAIVIGLGDGYALQTAAGGGVVGIDAKHLVVLALRVIVFSKVEIAFRRIETTAHLVHVLGMLIGERRIRADRIVEVTELALCIPIVRINGEDAFQKQAGFRVFPDLAVLHGERDTRIAEVGDIHRPAVR